ncbi:MAG: type II secretion system major pseudopilin GspG [Phycisphaerales bacterium]
MPNHASCEHSRPRSTALRRGFTLLEVMIVIVILLALATFVGINLLSSKDKATKDLVRVQMNSLKQGLNTFRIHFDRFPTDEEGLKVLWDKTALSSDSPADKWSGPYMDQPIEKDNWGSAWGYKQAGEKGPTGFFDLWSLGPDKQDGTEDDIPLWTLTTGGEGGADSNAPPSLPGGSAPSGN